MHGGTTSVVPVSYKYCSFTPPALLQNIYTYKLCVFPLSLSTRTRFPPSVVWCSDWSDVSHNLDDRKHVRKQSNLLINMCVVLLMDVRRVHLQITVTCFQALSYLYSFRVNSNPTAVGVLIIASLYFFLPLSHAPHTKLRASFFAPI